MTFPWPDDTKAHVTGLTEPVDCIVLGRNLVGSATLAGQAQAEQLTDPAAARRL